MVFEKSSFATSVSDPRYETLQKIVRVDGDSKAYELQFIPPQTAKENFVIPAQGSLTNGSVPCWNATSSIHRMEVTLGPDYRSNMSGCGLYIGYQCGQVRHTVGGGTFLGRWVSGHANNGYDANGTDAAGFYLPWHPANLINTASLKLNASQTPIEQYIHTGYYCHNKTLECLRKYKTESLEDMHETFFTPCLETQFDSGGVNGAGALTAGLISAESAKRTNTWCGPIGLADDASSAANSVPFQGSKVIPFSELFNCCSIPAVWNNTSKFVLEMSFNLPNVIPLRCGPLNANEGQAYVFITDLRVVFDSSRMAALQQLQSTMERQKGAVENVAYLQNSIISVNYAPSVQCLATNQSNVQIAALAFSANKRILPALGTTVFGSNPFQYHDGFLNNINIQYGTDMPLRSPLNQIGSPADCSADNSLQHALAYNMYKKACSADSALLLHPAVPFNSKWKCYHVYWFPFFFQGLPKFVGNGDIRIDTSSTDTGTATAQTALISVVKFMGAQIDSIGNVELLTS